MSRILIVLLVSFFISPFALADTETVEVADEQESMTDVDGFAGHRYWVCYAHNYKGQRFWAEHYNRNRAANDAMEACHYYSQGPISVCFSDGCRRQ